VHLIEPVSALIEGAEKLGYATSKALQRRAHQPSPPLVVPGGLLTCAARHSWHGVAG